MVRKAACATIILVFLLSFFAYFAFSQVGEWWNEQGSMPFDENTDSPLFTSYPGGITIDWQRKVVISKGKSALVGPMTVENRAKIRKNAENLALERLISLIELIRINGYLKLSDITDRNFGLRSDIASLVRKTYIVVHEKVHKDQQILEIFIEFELFGKAGLAGTFFPQYLKELPSPPLAKENSAESDSKKYSGLIIDASNLGIEGGLTPKVLSEDGSKVFYIKRKINKSELITKGFVDYAPAIAYSFDDVSRAGENPLIVTAKSKMKSPYNCDIVISHNDAEKIRKADATSNFLFDLKAVILL